MEYILKNENICIKFNSLGAEMVSIIHNKKERLWQNDNGSWSGHAPVLFPICGKIQVKIDNVIYPLLQHGFARRCEFVLLNKENNKISFILKDNKDTFKLFPYHFELIISYELIDNSIKISYIVKNNDDTKMYYSVGSHTSFSLDSKIDNYLIEFEYEEELINEINDRTPLLTGEKILLSKNGILDLSTNYIDDAKTLIFRNLKSKKATLIKKDGTILASIEFHDFPYILFWHPKDANMICMEPWHNILDSKETIDLNFKDKDGIIALDKNESKELKEIITYY